MSDQAATAERTNEVAPLADSTQATESLQEPKKTRKKRTKAVAPAPVQQTDEERIAQGKRVLGARSKAKALAKAQAEAEAAAQAALTAKRAAERRAAAQRRLEERKRQQTISDELKKPTEDMCLTDHKVTFVFLVKKTNKKQFWFEMTVILTLSPLPSLSLSSLASLEWCSRARPSLTA